MRSNWFLIILLLSGLSLMASAWLISYPLSINSANDWIFNNVSFLYWIGLPLTLLSLYLIGIRSQSTAVQCLVAIGIFLAIHSLSYFYFLLPGSDSQLFRGLNENFINTNSLASDNVWHYYYEWPLFFVLNKTMTLVTGLELAQFEFLLYTIIGSFIVSGLYLYFSAYTKKLSFLPVVVFSIAMFSFFNFQDVPFSLATSFLLIMFAIEKRFETNPWFRSKNILLLLLFIIICFTHLFVPIFFILFVALRYFLGKEHNYRNLFFALLIIYLSIQLFQAPISLEFNSRAIIDNALSSDLSKVVQQTFYSNTIPIDVVAQTFSRISFFLAISVSGLGFLILILKKRLTNVDKAFFLSGLIYLGIGFFLPILGSRALAFVFIPMSLGLYSFFKGHKEIALKIALLTCLVLFTFVSIHTTFFNQVHFQTKEVYETDNFMLDNYAWNNTTPPKIVIDFRQQNYLVTFKPDSAFFYGENSANFSRLNDYDCIVYTLGLGKSLAIRNINIDNSVQNSFDRIYSNGFSSIFVNGGKASEP